MTEQTLHYTANKQNTIKESNPPCSSIDQISTRRNEKIRLVILLCLLLALALAFALFLLTHNCLPLFITIVVTFFGYQRLDTIVRRFVK